MTTMCTGAFKQTNVRVFVFKFPTEKDSKQNGRCIIKFYVPDASKGENTTQTMCRFDLDVVAMFII